MLYALIVIYNKSLEGSITYNCIKDNGKIPVIVYDNSENDYGNSSFAEENGIVYYTQNVNVGLSKAYNYVIDKMDFKNDDYVMVLDDDTEITEEYLNDVFTAINKHEYDIILPIVRSGKHIISPANVQFGCRVKAVDNVSKIDPSRITAINSGMVISSKVYKSIRYDEELFLDYVDHIFMREVRKKKCSTYIMNSVINQNYSRDQKQEFEAVKRRYEIFKRDYYAYCRKCNKKLFYFLSITKLKIKYSIQYKRIV